VAAYTYCLVQEAQHHHQHHIDPYTSRSLRFAFAAQSDRRHLSTCNLQRGETDADATEGAIRLAVVGDWPRSQ
jgi:hypothetical protein